MAKKISDILASGLFLIGGWVLLTINGWLPKIAPWLGNIGGGVLVASQFYFLIKKWSGD